MTNLSQLAVRIAGRPHLITPAAANEILSQIAAADPSALRSERRLGAWFRLKSSLSGLANAVRPSAFDDEDAAAQNAAPPPPGGEAWSPLWMGEADDELGWGMTLKDGIACLNVDTALYASGEDFCGTWFHGYDTLTQAIREALADDRVDGVFIRMESPGGVVAGSLDMLVETLRARSKPIWTYAEQACSAAYWIASQTDRILAPRSGLVGSIGAVMLHVSVAGALQKAGVKATPIQFGAQKTAFADFQTLSEEALADLQAMVDECGRNFVADVSAGRPQLTEEALLATEARVFDAAHSDPARSGEALGFVDEIMTEEAAFAAFRSHLTAAPGAPAPAAKAAKTPTSTKGSDDMAGKSSKAARSRMAARARQRAKLEAQIRALDEEEVAEDEDMDPEAEEEEEPTAEGNPEDPEAEGDDEDLAAEGDTDDPEAEEDEEQPSADEEENRQARAEAILSYAHKHGMSALGQTLASDRSISLSKAKRMITAASRGDKLAARRDHRVGALPNSAGKRAASGLKAAAAKRNETRRAKREGRHYG